MKKITIMLFCVLAALQMTVAQTNYQMDVLFSNTTMNGNTGGNMRDMAFSSYDNQLLFLDKGNQNLCIYSPTNGTLISESSAPLGTGYSIFSTSFGSSYYTVGAYGMTGRFELKCYTGYQFTNFLSSGNGNNSLTKLNGARLDYVSGFGDFMFSSSKIASASVSISDLLCVWSSEVVSFNLQFGDIQSPYMFSNLRGGTPNAGADVNFTAANELWLSGQNQKPLFAVLDYTDTTAVTHELNMTSPAAVGGLGVFTLNQKNFVVVPTSALGAFDVYNVTAGPETAALVYSQTQDGSVANTTAHIACDAKVVNDTAIIYYFVPNNGVKAYKFYEAPVVTVDTVFETYNDTIAAYTTGFESTEGFAASTVYNKPNMTYGPAANQWLVNYGTPSTTDKISGAQSLQMRYYSTMPFAETMFDVDSISKVVFKATSTTSNNVTVSFSVDSGATYTGDSLFVLSTDANEFTYNMPQSDLLNVRFKFILTKAGTPTNKSRLTIDDVTFYTIQAGTRVMTPVITPAESVISDSTLVTIACATEGASIYYTLDGTEPTDTSNVYSAPFTIAPADVTIKAIAMMNGVTNSEVAVMSYVYVPNTQVIAPVITPAGGSYSDDVTVSMSCETEGASIYYTVDGTDPDSTTSTLYVDPFVLMNTTTVKAIAVLAGKDNSEVVTETYTLPVSVMVSDIADFYAQAAADTAHTIDQYRFTGDVTVSCQIGMYLYVTDASGAMLIYGAQDSVYVNGDVLTGIKGKSAIYGGQYQLQNSVLPAAVAGTPVAAEVKQLSDLTVTDVNRYIQLNGVVFTSKVTYKNDEAANGSITDGVDTLILRSNYKQIAHTYNAGDRVNVVGIVSVYKGAVQVYPIVIEDAPLAVVDPTINPEGGNISAPIYVSISTPTIGASIYYTIDDSTPDTTSTLYTDSFVVSSSLTVKAIAVKEGAPSSQVVSQSYVYVAPEAVETPVILPVGGVVTDTVTVTMSCATTGATIYYTVDGNDPDTATSAVYTTGFDVTATTTVKAVAVKEGMTMSAIASATYTFPVAPVVTEVASIADFFTTGAAGLDSAEYKITDTLTVAYQNYKSLYLTDGTDWLLLYGNMNGVTLTNGQTLAGIQGKYVVYNGLVQMAEFILPTPGVGTPVVPMNTQMSTLVDDDLNSYVKLDNVTFTDSTTFTSNATTNANVEQNGTNFVLRNSFRMVGTYAAGRTYNVEGFVSSFQGALQIYPILIEDITTGVESASLMPIYVQDGAVYVPANVGDLIEVYTVAGQRLLQVTADASVMVFSNLPENQILMVRVANQVSKVIVK